MQEIHGKLNFFILTNPNDVSWVISSELQKASPEPQRTSYMNFFHPVVLLVTGRLTLLNLRSATLAYNVSYANFFLACFNILLKNVR